MSTSRRAVLKLYRDVLKAAQRFPSRNRAALLVELRTEFRVGSAATDPVDVERCERLSATLSLEQARDRLASCTADLALA